MYIERFFIPGLAHASYLIAAEGEAVVIDPERDVSRYVDYLAQNKLKLIGIFLTHPHADFVAGHAELSSGGMHAVRHAKRPRLPAVELAENALTWEI
jgi:glyoxylase-like metal-dependent hydrolase (beta-lactamase superfamily II)